jgi:hypothetical protein
MRRLDAPLKPTPFSFISHIISYDDYPPPFFNHRHQPPNPITLEVMLNFRTQCFFTAKTLSVHRVAPSPNTPSALRRFSTCVCCLCGWVWVGGASNGVFFHLFGLCVCVCVCLRVCARARVCVRAGIEWSFVGCRRLDDARLSAVVKQKAENEEETTPHN